MASIGWAKTTARREEKHLSFAIRCDLYQRFDGTRCMIFPYNAVVLSGVLSSLFVTEHPQVNRHPEVTCRIVSLCQRTYYIAEGLDLKQQF